MDPHGRDDPARPDVRRRDGGRVLAWSPDIADSTASAAPVEQPVDDPAEPDRPDTLGDLDLVVTPVSVTPPPTWRRAAWFAVGASCVVLTVLVFAAANLTGSSFDRIEAFPGLPTGGLLTAQPLGPPLVHPTTAATPAAGKDGPMAQGTRPSATADHSTGAAPRGDDRTGAREQPSPTGSTPTQADTPYGGEAATQPTVSVKPSTGPTTVTADELLAGTTTFYDLVARDIDSAWAMTGPRVRVRGYDSFHRQWAGVREVDLQKAVVDVDSSSVLATVRVVEANGTEHVDTYYMVFRQGSSLIVDEISAMPDTGRKPAG